MADDADKNWEELLQVFTHDIASSLPYIEAYAGMLEAYLEKLGQQENIPTISLASGQEINFETALKLIRILREHSDKLHKLKNAMSHDVGMGTGPILSYMEERKKLMPRP
jgi:hypothetical protein